MRNFTRFFLSGKHTLLSVFRKIGLSAITLFFACAAFADAEPQETYHVWAEVDSSCYRADNTYDIDISMRDFIKIDTFTLVLDYDETTFNYAGYSNLIDTLDNGTFQIDNVGGKLTITWGAGDPLNGGTIGDGGTASDVETVVFTLQFQLATFPHSYGPVNDFVFGEAGNLSWVEDETSFFNVSGQDIVEILTDFTSDGSLVVTQEIEDIELDITAADCYGGDAVVTVITTADAYAYNNYSTFTTNSSTSTTAPAEDQTVVIKVGECMSYIKTYDVESLDPLAYETEDVVYTNCPNGYGDIEIFAEGGSGSYTYYVVPEAVSSSVQSALTGASSQSVAMDVLEDYEFSNSVLQREVGLYYVAVQDGNECQDMRDLQWWTAVEVLDTLDAWTGDVVAADADCYGETGTLTFSFAGATPFDGGEYELFVDGVGMGRESSPYVLTAVAGTYELMIVDANGCDTTIAGTIGQPDEIIFDALTHTDAGCEADNGTITLDEQAFIDGDNGGTFTVSGGSYWILDTLPDFSSATPVWMGDLDEDATGLGAHVYYARIYDDNGCSADYTNINNDNAIKVFTYEAELSYDPVLCNGGTTWVTVEITGDNSTHDFEFTVNHGVQTTASTQNGWTLEGGTTYTFTVYDLTIDCSFSITERITQPAPLELILVDAFTLAPTCSDNTDGSVTVRAYGGTRFDDGNYRFKMDKGDWIQTSEYNTFAVDVDAHWIYVEDANGCMDSVLTDFVDGEYMIDFVNTIYTECAESEINLFNRYPGGDNCNPFFGGLYNSANDVEVAAGPYAFWSLDEDCLSNYDGASFMDMGYINDYEFYGIPAEHFTGVVYDTIQIWTSDSGWVSRPLNGYQQERNPYLYITDVDPEGDPANIIATGEVYTHTTSQGAGTYWVVTKDEWGCYSNIEEIEIIDPDPLEITASANAAGCDGATDGQVIIEAFNGRFDIDAAYGRPVRYQYVLTQQSEVFANDNWAAEASWLPFTSNLDANNDSVLVVNVQDGTYYIAIRDWCGIENPDLIQYAEVTVEGLDAVGNDALVVENVSCNVAVRPVMDAYCGTSLSADDGSITNVINGAYGGSEGFYASLVSGGVEYTYDADIDGFDNLPAGIYTLTITDDSLGCEYVKSIEITEPEALRAVVDVINPSCNDNHDGLLRYKITGGVAPYYEVTENYADGFESIDEIPEERWVSVEDEGWYEDYDYMENDDHLNEALCGETYEDVFMFDRRVRADEKQIWVKDATGCIYGPIEVLIEEPGELAINPTATAVSCNDYAAVDGVLYEGDIYDGSILIEPEGGWDMYMDDFMFTARLYNSADVAIQEISFDTIPANGILFSGLAAGDYSVKLFEYSDDIASTGYSKPVISYPEVVGDVDYSSDESTWGQFAPYQNPDTTACFAMVDVTVEEPTPIVYDVQWNTVQCYNTATGSIELTNISGGTPADFGTSSGLNGYWVGIQGPDDYDSTMVDTPSGTEYIDYSNMRWFETLDDEFTFNNLPYGHYTIHIMDENDCWVYKESGEVSNVDTLEIVVLEKVEDATCYGGTGIIQIDATGGTGAYMYAVDSTLVPHPGTHNFPEDFDSEAYLAGLDWQESDTFEVTAATWVAYVMDESGCVAGYSTDAEGTPLMHHRTTVLEPDSIIITGTSSTDVTCYGYATGSITIDEITGGNGAPWSISVTGLAYDGSAVAETYSSSSSSDIVLDGLYASETVYEIVVTDAAGCVSVAYTQAVDQPEPFIVTIEDKQNSFICPGDQGGLYEIVVVSGGVPIGTNAAGEDIFKYKWEVYEDADYTILVDSLTDDTWGTAKTLNGYGGLYYKVWAQDANLCETSMDTLITAPTPIEFTVQDLSCGSTDKASARVTATWTNNRKWRVWYKELEQEVAGEPADYTLYGSWNEPGTYLDMLDTLIFDIESVQDVHYAFMIEDSLGCTSEPDTMTFDYEDYAFEVSDFTVVAGVCNTEISYNVSGAEGQFSVSVNGTVVDTVGTGAQTLTLTEEGTNTVVIKELEGICSYSVDVEVTPVVDYVAETFNVFTGDSAVYVNADAGIDTLLAAGEHTFTYDSPSADACYVEATVTVAAYDVPVAILDTVMPGDTIADSHPIFEIEFDASTPVVFNGEDTVVYYLTVTKLDSADASLMIPITEDMVSGTTVTVDYDWTVYGALVTNTTYVVTVDSGAIWSYSEDVMAPGAAWDANVGTWTFTTGSEIATGIDDGFEAIDYSIYPNPFDNSITIDNGQNLDRVIVTNIAGQRVLDVVNPSNEIETGNLVKGVYVISLISNNEIVKSERLIKR